MYLFGRFSGMLTYFSMLNAQILKKILFQIVLIRNICLVVVINTFYTLQNIAHFHSWILGRYGSNFKNVIFKVIQNNSNWGTWCEIALRGMPQNTVDDNSTLIQLMALCHQATNHDLSQYCPNLWHPMASLGHGVLTPRNQMTHVHVYASVN